MVGMPTRKENSVAAGRFSPKSRQSRIVAPGREVPVNASASACGSGALVPFAALRTGAEPLRNQRPTGVHRLEMLPQFGVEVYAPGFPVFRVGIRADGEPPVLEIHVGPAELDGFLFAGAAERPQTDVIGELWTAAYVPEPVLAPFHPQRAEFVLSLGQGRACQGHPLDRLAPGLVFDGDPRPEAAVAPPQPANCELAIVQDLGVSVSA